MENVYGSMLVAVSVIVIGMIIGQVVRKWLAKSSKYEPTLLHKIKTGLTLCVFHGFSVSEVLQMARKYDLRRSMNKDIVYGALMQLSNNRNVWHEQLKDIYQETIKAKLNSIAQSESIT